MSKPSEEYFIERYTVLKENGDCEHQEQDEEIVSDSESESSESDLNTDSHVEVDESEYIDECSVNASHFEFITKLGIGAFATVFLVKKNCGIDIDKIYAIKVISKDEVVKFPKTIVHMKAERKVLEIFRGDPFIPQLYYAFQTPDKLFLVMDYVPGGEMITLLQKEIMNVERVCFYIAELILALEHIHKHGIVYRDIKLENILIDADGHIKLVDFGLCKKLGPRGRANTFCGTVEYMAPEIIACTGHNFAADWWAIGVLTIELLSTVTPFGTNDNPDSSEIMNRITNEGPVMPENLSPEMKDFIVKMLEKDPTRRLGGNNVLATDIKAHPLFDDIDWDKLVKKQVQTPEIPNISDSYDTRNFSEDFTAQPPTYEPSAIPPRTFHTFKGYSYIAPELNHTQSDHDINISMDEELNILSCIQHLYNNREPDSRMASDDEELMVKELVAERSKRLSHKSSARIDQPDPFYYFKEIFIDGKESKYIRCNVSSCKIIYKKYPDYSINDQCRILRNHLEEEHEINLLKKTHKRAFSNEGSSRSPIETKRKRP